MAGRGKYAPPPNPIEAGFGGMSINNASGEPCYKCQKTGHLSRDCPNGVQAPRTNGTGNDNPNYGGGRGGGGGGGGDNKCFNCNELGHRANECSEPRTARTRDDGSTMAPPVTYVPMESTTEELFTEHIVAGVGVNQWDTVPVKRDGPGVDRIPVLESFDQANLAPRVMENIRRMKYTNPSPVQKHCIPIVLAGMDLLSCAQTGSGKTAAFILPVLRNVMERGDFAIDADDRRAPAAIIVAPTRELAVQIHEDAKKLGDGTPVRTCVVYGGTSVSSQASLINYGVDIVVGTAGRLCDFVQRGYITMQRVRFFILDEADRMLDMGFEPKMKELHSARGMAGVANRQTLMFSATFPREVQQLARHFMKPDRAMITVDVIGGANKDITQVVEAVGQFEKKDRILQLLRQDIDAYKQSGGRYDKKTLVFVSTKINADFIATLISKKGLPATSMHGDRDQSQREAALRDFKRGHMAILVATEVAARGLDIKGVDHVINYDMPQQIDQYVHRIGRTGRVGNAGRSTSFYDEMTDVGMRIPLIKVRPFLLDDDDVQVLTDAGQNVPEWMTASTGGRSYGGGGGGGGGGAVSSEANWDDESKPGDAW